MQHHLFFRKKIILLFAIVLTACNNRQNDTITNDTETLRPASHEKIIPQKPTIPLPKVFSNERFKEVTVVKAEENKYVIKGKGQIFEASFSWVVDDGHEELQKGFQMTDAGAPEWGNFLFTVEVNKKRPNSTLTLILFESSAKDGSRQYELPIILY
ncbi:Gmad2 immunoglobulin-like domain-containing protein [Flavobacterium sp. GT3R68]|uniref:Gmad2 immunoglobulin-like domain-containing protein n=1 Tax=Flavobacterium sp. GT3R68 TaxID=2594437 RepID=UPI000F860CDF|nr:Gmad2 immunoglobulin-like domain-containing protein [Flavobacterium sp. GT3R68]RTY89833.1 sporulation protein [Flavobacterium sp. GSN2]TRW89812.1 sporulation protein [Flavobacterium sp. GT3R68]